MTRRPLFRQAYLAFDMEGPDNSRRPPIRLASSDADRVIAWSDDWISLLSHHTQIAVVQVEMNRLARA